MADPACSSGQNGAALTKFVKLCVLFLYSLGTLLFTPRFQVHGLCVFIFYLLYQPYNCRARNHKSYTLPVPWYYCIRTDGPDIALSELETDWVNSRRRALSGQRILYTPEYIRGTPPLSLLELSTSGHPSSQSLGIV